MTASNEVLHCLNVSEMSSVSGLAPTEDERVKSSMRHRLSLESMKSLMRMFLPTLMFTIHPVKCRFGIIPGKDIVFCVLWLSTRRRPAKGGRDKLRSPSTAEIVAVSSAILCVLSASALKKGILLETASGLFNEVLRLTSRFLIPARGEEPC